MAAPTFIGVGMQKSGTRWLYQQLLHHPDFWMPPLKEFAFFSGRFPSARARAIVANPNRLHGPADHEFSRRVLALEPRHGHGPETYFSLFEPAGGRLTGEITPEYAALPAERIADLAAAMPGTKVVLMVRDPTERAWSALNDAVNAGKIDAAAVTNPGVMVATLEDRVFARVSYASEAHRRWSRAFPTRFFFLEDVAARAEETRAAVLQWLGASTTAAVGVPAWYNSKAGRPRAPLTPELRAALVRHFEDEILRCAETFGGPAAAWPAKHGLVPEPPMAKLDRELDALRQGGEAITFAQFYAKTALKSVSAGEKHATLGNNLAETAAWGSAGLGRYDLLRRLTGGPARAIRVVDYGCGSLRIGQHFIRDGAPGSYLGLDVIPDFYRMGLTQLGDEVVARKRPVLGLIGDAAAEDRAAAHEADLVLASAVAFHVHPDEIGTFAANIERFSRKPGCVVLFDAMIYPEEVRYAHRGWARPLRFYTDLFPGLRHVGSHRARPDRRDGREMSMELIEFRR